MEDIISRFGLENCSPVVYSYKTAMDNHEPAPHRFGHGYVVKYTNWRGDTNYLISPDDIINNSERCLFIIDDGNSVVITYVISWRNNSPELITSPFPLSNGIREDNGQPVDMSDWTLGPRKTYHLKIS